MQVFRERGDVFWRTHGGMEERIFYDGLGTRAILYEHVLDIAIAAREEFDLLFGELFRRIFGEFHRAGEFFRRVGDEIHIIFGTSSLFVTSESLQDFFTLFAS